MRRMTTLSIFAAFAITACQTTQPEAPVVVIAPEPVQTCVSVATVQKVTIPAETRSQRACTLIDNGPYDPIESCTDRTIIVKSAQVMYVDNEGKEVIDLCEDNVQIGAVGPGEGSLVDENGILIPTDD